jgi:hypothetical protein
MCGKTLITVTRNITLAVLGTDFLAAAVRERESGGHVLH